jgi:tRNA (guanine-N(7)-)-methyltransferase subunit TRM82
MPKRPCDVAITEDSLSLLVADKFGDVYWLPVIPSLSQDPSTSKPRAQQPILESKGANHLTVHSQRNLRALEEQIKQREKQQQQRQKQGTNDDDESKRDAAAAAAGPAFEHNLLMGHVSMLTAVTAASHQGKPYILTADRDEHIRISRGIPQAHVIERFCLGHTSFVNALSLLHPGNLLISGGGDDALVLWDWTTGDLRGTIDLLGHVRSIVPEATKIAVTKLISVGETGEVVALCERYVASHFPIRDNEGD